MSGKVNFNITGNYKIVDSEVLENITLVKDYNNIKDYSEYQFGVDNISNNDKAQKFGKVFSVALLVPFIPSLLIFGFISFFNVFGIIEGIKTFSKQAKK